MATDPLNQSSKESAGWAITNYCRQEENAGGYGLGAAIGACGTKQTELVNAYSTLARMGVQKDVSSVVIGSEKEQPRRNSEKMER
ncbi:hypothetical protein KOY48_03385 [Candidatus Minimicrobia naudis]|uniref:Uncharacterized protein n=1 Tax=Candidatus Minimicrobia naudis TaxID=2841263 RepID=A0A8F1MBP1_9BACT|nr:hypothetical protein KOY48_03385 [Candidatus Minimicrobia naudis]